jgi:ABC-type Mn2+/Zn2+ transport system ATPase subunit
VENTERSLYSDGMNVNPTKPDLVIIAGPNGAGKSTEVVLDQGIFNFYKDSYVRD